MHNPFSLQLWPSGCPNKIKTSAIPEPTITVYKSEENKESYTAILICPGGGYRMLSTDYEGHQVALWLNKLGVVAFVLQYRHKDYRHPIPFQDAQRAMRTIRQNSKKWKISQNRIGILGFSAGGHLAATLSTHFEGKNTGVQDPIDRQDDRPDFMLLAYPVISMKTSITNSGSRLALLGPHPDPKLIEKLSIAAQVNKNTPPTFMVHCTDDSAAIAENSLEMYRSFKKENVPVEIHIFEKGGHGFGLIKQNFPVDVWPKQAEAWMRGHDFIV